MFKKKTLHRNAKKIQYLRKKEIERRGKTSETQQQLVPSAELTSELTLAWRWKNKNETRKRKEIGVNFIKTPCLTNVAYVVNK